MEDIINLLIELKVLPNFFFMDPFLMYIIKLDFFNNASIFISFYLNYDNASKVTYLSLKWKIGA